MFDRRWERVQLSIKTKVRKCPDCRALVEDIGTDMQEHMAAHYPDPEPESYEYAEGVTVARPPGALRQIRDIFRLRPPRETVPAPDTREADWAALRGLIERVTAQPGERAEQVDEDWRAQGSDDATHGSKPV